MSLAPMANWTGYFCINNCQSVWNQLKEFRFYSRQNGNCWWNLLSRKQLELWISSDTLNPKLVTVILIFIYQSKDVFTRTANYPCWKTTGKVSKYEDTRDQDERLTPGTTSHSAYARRKSSCSHGSTPEAQ